MGVGLVGANTIENLSEIALVFYVLRMKKGRLELFANVVFRISSWFQADKELSYRASHYSPPDLDLDTKHDCGSRRGSCNGVCD